MPGWFCECLKCANEWIHTRDRPPRSCPGCDSQAILVRDDRGWVKTG